MQLQLPLGSNEPDIQHLYRARDRFQQSRVSPVTLKDYQRDMRAFKAWCDRMNRSAMPASPDTLSLYATDLLMRGRKVSTVARYVAGVDWTHRASGIASPLTEAVKDILWGARCSRSETPRQMQPITLKQVRKIAKAFESEATPRALRNRAIVVVGFASALRRSNLVNLLYEDIRFCEDGMIVRVRREKQDPAGLRPRVIGIPWGRNKTACPVLCLKAWLKYRGTHNGPLFTAIGSKAGLQHNAIWEIVRGAVERIGLNPQGYGPHSLRAGLITEAGQRGLSPLLIAAQSGHRSFAVLQRYFRPSEAFRANVCDAIGL